MTISVIGSESFLAKNFIRYLEENDSESVIIKLYDYIPAESTANGEKFEYLQIDFENLDSISQIDFDVDAVMIFIGITGTASSFNNYEACIKVNEIYLLNILEAYVKAKSKARIIYPSSRLIYKQSDVKRINEDSDVEFKSVYAVTKYAAERYLELYKLMYGIDYVTLHICTPIGSLISEVGNYGTFEIFINQAKKDKKITVFGTGNQRKTFTDIEDICKAFWTLCSYETVEQTSYNLGGCELSIKDIAEKIGVKYGVPVIHDEWPEIYKKVDGGTVVFDSSRFDTEFDFSYREIL